MAKLTSVDFVDGVYVLETSLKITINKLGNHNINVGKIYHNTRTGDITVEDVNEDNVWYITDNVDVLPKRIANIVTDVKKLRNLYK